MQMRTLGLCRSVESKHRNDIPGAELFLPSEFPKLLSECDYIVNALPSTSDTIGMLNGDIWKDCKKGCVFINIGRGDICTEEGRVVDSVLIHC